MAKPFTRDEARGMLVGLAVGDALGTTLEFTPRAKVRPISDMVGSGPFRLAPGVWTDDTAMALCLAESILACGGWCASDAMRRFVLWRDEGYLSATGDCFDIGVQTDDALERFLRTGDPVAGPTEEVFSGNGGIMRLAPVVIAFGRSLAEAEAAARAQSALTHASPACLEAASAMARVLVTGSRDALPAPHAPPAEATGWVRHTMEAAAWALGQGEDPEAVLLAAVNLGGDADTVGAVTGQLAGRIWGHSALPPHWLARLHDHDSIVALADRLYDMTPSTGTQ